MHQNRVCHNHSQYSPKTTFENHEHAHTHTHKVRTNKLNSVLKGLESERDNKLFSFHSQLYVTHLVRTEGSVLHLDTALALLDGVEHNVIKV